MPRSNDFSLAQALEAFLEESGMGDRQRWHRLETHWAEVVGAPIARETERVTFQDGVCTLYIRSAVWRQQLLLQKTDLLSRLNQSLGKPLVTELRIG